MAGFYIENFGCRASQADGEAIARQLASANFEPEARDTAAIVVLNTCTVTAEADREARAAIRRVHRVNPLARILVTGCYAQRAPEELSGLPGVRWVAGNSHKHLIGNIVRPALSHFVPIGALLKPKAEVHVGDIFAHTEFLASPVFTGQSRTRPNLKVQDGCDNRCSFCVIPSVRGQSRSRGLRQVIEDVNGLVAAGFREVVVSGINLGRWGRDLTPAMRFENLVEAILAETSLEKLRISSVEPMDWTDGLIALIRSTPRIARHAHIPMQSGSDSVLRRMHRKYRPWHYRERVAKIRAALPTAAIGADVMTGFPGETDTEFEETVRMVEELPLTYLHVFPYSPRPGTPASRAPCQVPVHIARNRHQVLSALIARKQQDFAHAFVGQILPAIAFLSAREGASNALTDNFLDLHLSGPFQPNQWLRVRVAGSENGILTGAPA